MDGSWIGRVPLDGTWLTFLMAIGALGVVGTVVALLQQRTPRIRVDLARLARRGAPSR